MPQRLWLSALERLGHEVRVFRYSDAGMLGAFANRGLAHSVRRLPKAIRTPIDSLVHRTANANPEFRARNRRLLLQAAHYQPDVILLSGGSEIIRPPTIQRLKALSNRPKIALLHGSPPIYSATRAERTFARYVDAIYTNDDFFAADWTMLGAKRSVNLPVSACDPEVHHPSLEAASVKRHTIAFVGTLNGLMHERRWETLDAVADLGLAIWAPEFPAALRSARLFHCYQGPLLNRDLQVAYTNCTLGLNIHSHTMLTGGNLATFQIPAFGAPQLIDRFKADWFTAGRDVVQYSSPRELRSCVESLLGQPGRQRDIACAGHRRATTEHTYERRFAGLLDNLNNSVHEGGR